MKSYFLTLLVTIFIGFMVAVIFLGTAYHKGGVQAWGESAKCGLIVFAGLFLGTLIAFTASLVFVRR